jgi:caa(3)-type oxidase subunit IV
MSEPHNDPNYAPTMSDVDKPAQVVSVYFVVIALAAANIAIAYTPLGKLALPVQLAIATVQAVFVAFYWMHMRRKDQMVALCVATALFFMGIFYILVFSDYLTRYMGAM